jgi:hypothetical protein
MNEIFSNNLLEARRSLKAVVDGSEHILLFRAFVWYFLDVGG